MKKKHTVAYYGVKLATYYITKDEHVAVLAGLVRSKFFEKLAARVSIGCSTESDLEFQLAVANLYLKVIELVKDKDTLEAVWQSQKNLDTVLSKDNDSDAEKPKKLMRKKILKRQGSDSSQRKSQVSTFTNDDYYPGADLFISEDLKFLSCLEVWLDGLTSAFDTPKLHGHADKLALVVHSCLENILSLQT